jgi:homoserine dehydrogenase
MKLALIGFGVVGQGLAEILRDKGASIAEKHGFDGQIVAVSDFIKGAVYHPDGLDPDALLNAVADGGKLDSYPDAPGLIRGMDSLQTIRQSNADAIVEVTYTDIKTGQPATDHVRAALESGKHVATTNKGPIALNYRELSALAEANGVQIGFEGTVMSGTPALALGMQALAGCDVTEVRGIFNGTCNYILTQMAKGTPYSSALEDAQELGYAEADPSADVEGFDTMGKVLILANTVMGAELSAADVECTGITALTLDDIKHAAASNEHWKLLGFARKQGNGVVGKVEPVRVPGSDPLASITGATNAITYETDLLGAVTLVGPGAGKTATGFALLADLLGIQRRT